MTRWGAPEHVPPTSFTAPIREEQSIQLPGFCLVVDFESHHTKQRRLDGGSPRSSSEGFHRACVCEFCRWRYWRERCRVPLTKFFGIAQELCHG